MKTAALAFAAFSTLLGAQWLNYPTARVPRLANGQPNLTAPTPRTADGKPDFTGLWETGTEDAERAPVAGAALLPPEFLNVGSRIKGGLPYKPWARELWNARQANNFVDNPDGKCLPLSILQLHSHPFPRKIVQAPGLIVILYEKNVLFRQIFTDGRPLPVDPQPSFFGYSSAKWDGDTLVVETAGFREDSWADGGGTPFTDAAKITERFRRPNYGNLEIDITVDDSKAYTAPWSFKVSQHIKLDTDILEYVCLENEKDRVHMVGK